MVSMKVGYELYTLKNGAQILLIPSDAVNSINIIGLLKSGSALEKQDNQGITHFVEHMTLTCTEKWKTKESMSEEIEFNGGITNGGTAHEYLSYNINIPNTKLEFGLTYIHQILYHASFEDENIEIERSIILDELSKYEDNVYYRAGEFTLDNLLEKKSAYSFEIGGNKDTVKGFTKEDLLNQYKYSHSPERLLLCVVGNFKLHQAKKIIGELFEPIPCANIPNEYPTEALKDGIVLSKADKKTDLVICDVIMKYKGIPDISFEEYILSQFSCVVLSGPQTSRLNQRLREKEGLLYSISCSSSTRIPYGNFQIGFEVKPKFYEKTINVLLDELSKFYENGLSEKELEHYKEYITNRFIVKYDNIYTYSNLIRIPVFYNEDVKTLNEIIEAFKSLTLKEVNTYIRNFFNPFTASYVAYGAVDKETKPMIENTLSKYK